jgi:hypothetical protein
MASESGDRSAETAGGRRGLERRFPRDVTPSAPLVVRPVPDLVLCDAGQPRHQRATRFPLELVDAVEGTEQRRLQDVTRLDAGAEGGPHAQPDEGVQLAADLAIEAVERLG